MSEVSTGPSREDPGATVTRKGESGRGPAPAPGVKAGLALTFQSGSLTGQRFEIAAPRSIVIGRSSKCDIAVFDARVSRRHCSIQFDGHLIHVKDLGSANGTILNGLPVRLSRAHAGDVLRLGDEVQLRIELGGSDRTVKLARSSAVRCPGDSGRILRDRSLGVSIPGFAFAGLLGEGATSAVFEARRVKQGDTVAVKVLKFSDEVRLDDHERFLREAAMTARLVHPNIVRVLDHGAIGTRLYIVMEYVRGETIGARLRRLGRLPVPFALNVARQIASALDYARTHGVVHRDVKPENILLQEDGVAKLGDFGLAKYRLDGEQPNGLTQVGDVLGTLAYMSPEQLESPSSAGHSSDIYSLGATLHHMIAGETPFQAPTSEEYFHKILAEDAPALTLVRPEVPSIAGALVQRCLRKRPAERFATARELERLANELLASVEGRQTAV